MYFCYILGKEVIYINILFYGSILVGVIMKKFGFFFKNNDSYVFI